MIDRTTLARLGDYYDGFEGYEAWSARVGRYQPRVERFLQREARRVLDVGCGPGHLTRPLAAGVHVAGVDISAKMVERARAGRPSGDYRVHSYYDPLPEDMGRFDLVLAVGCMEFCEDLPRVFGNLRAALADGGRLLVTTVERRAGLPFHEEPTRAIAKIEGTRIHYYERGEVEAAFAGRGLAALSSAACEGWYYGDIGVMVRYLVWELEPRASAGPPTARP